MSESRQKPHNFLLSLVVVIAVASVLAVLVPATQASGTGAVAGRQTGFAASRQASTSTPVQVDKGDVVLNITATGTILAAQQSNLSFDSTGIVSDVKVEEGQQVKAGDLLAEVVNTDQQYALTQAQQNLVGAQAALDKLLQPIDAHTIAIAQGQRQVGAGCVDRQAFVGQ